MPKNLISVWGSESDYLPGTAPSPAIDSVAGNTASSASLTTVSTSLTVASNSTRAMIALIGNNQAATALTVVSVAYTAGSGGAWAKLGSIIASSGANGLEIWYSTGPSTGSVTAQATMSGTGAGGSNNLVLYSVYNAPTPADTYTSSIAATVSISVAASGLVLAYLISNGSPGAITQGVQDYSDPGSVGGFFYAGHNSGTNPVTVAWTTTANGRGINACRVI